MGVPGQETPVSQASLHSHPQRVSKIATPMCDTHPLWGSETTDEILKVVNDIVTRGRKAGFLVYPSPFCPCGWDMWDTNDKVEWILLAAKHIHTGILRDKVPCYEMPPGFLLWLANQLMKTGKQAKEKNVVHQRHYLINGLRLTGNLANSRESSSSQKLNGTRDSWAAAERRQKSTNLVHKERITTASLSSISVVELLNFNKKKIN